MDLPSAPFTCVVDGEMFLTYAEDEATARAAFESEGLPKRARVLKQPMRKPKEFRYTHATRGTTTATLIPPADTPEDLHDAPTLDLTLEEALAE